MLPFGTRVDLSGMQYRSELTYPPNNRASRHACTDPEGGQMSDQNTEPASPQPRQATGDVIPIQSWQLPIFLKTLVDNGHATVGWNRDTIPLDEAIERAEALTPTATVVVDGTTIYVAEPDHSADDPALHRGPVAFVKRRPQ